MKTATTPQVAVSLQALTGAQFSGGVAEVSSTTIPLVQVLRAVAALLVLLGHIQSHAIVAAGADTPFGQQSRLPGGLGVDLFFAISGFIMVVSSVRLFEQPGAWRIFLLRRAVRLVPLYWLATLAFLPVVLWGSRGHSVDLLAALGTALAFIPYHALEPGGLVAYPLLSLGWTLNYEVLFYVLFSAAIVLPMSRAVPVVTFGLLLLVLAGAWVESTQTGLYFWTRPIVLEFAFGAFIAWMWIRNFRLTMPLSMLILLAAVALVVVDPWGLRAATAGTSTPNDLVRVMGWGLPAAAVLAAAVLLEPSGRSTPRSLSPLVTLGDWSYALYLTHTFALIVVVNAWKLLELQSVFGALALAVVQVAAAVIVAGLVYRWFELPVTTALRRRFC